MLYAMDFDTDKLGYNEDTHFIAGDKNWNTIQMVIFGSPILLKLMAQPIKPCCSIILDVKDEYRRYLRC